MGVAYLYSPITAWAYNHGPTDRYCSIQNQMVDLSREAAAGHNIDVYVNYPSVKSVEFIRVDTCCPCTSNTKNAVKVNLYSSYGKVGYIGAVLYGHMTNPLGSQWKNLGGNWAGSVGKVLGFDYCYCFGDPSSNTGAHVHLETWGGTRLTPSTIPYVYAGSTAIYRWYY